MHAIAALMQVAKPITSSESWPASIDHRVLMQPMELSTSLPATPFYAFAIGEAEIESRGGDVVDVSWDPVLAVTRERVKAGQLERLGRRFAHGRFRLEFVFIGRLSRQHMLVSHPSILTLAL